jgi:hypothetical protein
MTALGKRLIKAMDEAIAISKASKSPEAKPTKTRTYPRGPVSPVSGARPRREAPP